MPTKKTAESAAPNLSTDGTVLSPAVAYVLLSEWAKAQGVTSQSGGFTVDGLTVLSRVAGRDVEIVESTSIITQSAWREELRVIDLELSVATHTLRLAETNASNGIEGAAETVAETTERIDTLTNRASELHAAIEKASVETVSAFTLDDLSFVVKP